MGTDRQVTRERILDGLVSAASRYGLARLSLDDVATAAGVSRQTVYRYFGNRDAVIAAAILREEEAMIGRMLAAAERHADLRPALEAALAEVLHAARAHPLLDRLLADEPQALLPFLTSGSAPVLAAARPVMERLLAGYLPHVTEPALHRAADAATRLIISYTIDPVDDAIDDVAAGLADLIVNGVKDAEGVA